MGKFFIYLLLCLSMLLSTCEADTVQTFPIDQISEDLGVSVESGTVLGNWDTHGGWLGDGDSFVKISFSAEQGERLIGQIQDSTYWKPFPLTDNLTAALYGNSPHGFLIFKNDEGDPLLPPIRNGYYFFEDRFSESTDPADDSDLYKRGAFNFTLAVYNLDAHVLYYLRFDT